MNAVPKRWFHDDGDLKAIGWHADASGIFIQCEVIAPPSMKGRSVTIHITGDEVEWLMKELRDVAIARRNKPEGETCA